MPVIKAAIDPITRIEGHLNVEVTVDTVGGVQQVVEARSSGTLFRGFEILLQGRDPRDAPIITSRICGVCPTAHAKAAALTLDRAFGVQPPEASRLLRNLVEGCSMLESHILHFYVLSLPDYFQGPGKGPWLPAWDTGRRFDAATLSRLQAGYLAAIEKRRRVHEMAAIFGGKLPHTPAYIAGGFTAVAKQAHVDAFAAVLAEVTAFIRDTYLPDVELVASLYDEYFSLGRGPANLLSYGAFEMNAAGTQKLFPAGVVYDGGSTVLPFDVARITEHVTAAWYADATNGLHPSIGQTVPQYPKQNGYSWLKGPRYDAAVFEVGPLARMWMNGEYRDGVSVMDRHRARAREALKFAVQMQAWLNALPLNTSAYTPAAVPSSGTAAGLTEAPRGALGHWLRIENRKIAHYQIISPTCWNASPRDEQNRRGALEEALIGCPVANVNEPIEALRIIHSFDPCLDCATHVHRADEARRIFAPGGGRAVP